VPIVTAVHHAPVDGDATGLNAALVSEVGVEHGWPFYVADVDRLRANINRLRDALAWSVCDAEIAYSLKTNYLAAFLHAARELDVTAEVVSELEFHYARDLGFAAPDILVNGPGKGQSFLGRALVGGSRVNVDSLEELDAVSRIAEGAGRDLDIGVRVAFAFDGESRFGLDLAEPSVLHEVRRVLREGRVRVVGAHLHTSGRRSPESFGARLRRLAAAFDALGTTERPDYLDVGGGIMGSLPADLAAQLSEPAATYGEYAEVLGQTLRSLYGDDQPRLILEPGTGLLADTMSLYAPVVSLKCTNGQTVAITTASYLDVRPLRGPINPPVRVLGLAGAPSDRCPSGPIRLVGDTCMEIDMLHDGFGAPVRDLRVGDVLEFRNVGAYTLSLRPSFIEPAPAVVECPQSSGPARVLRPRMSARDFGRLYGGPS
jgi:diaminopimelate decarboxylase